MKKRIVETEVLREKPQSIANKKKGNKSHEKEKKWKIERKKKCKNEREKNVKHNINIISILRHSIAISQPFMIICFIFFTAVKRQENAQNQQNK